VVGRSNEWEKRKVLSARKRKNDGNGGEQSMIDCGTQENRNRSDGAREMPSETVKSASGTLVVFTSSTIDRSRGYAGMANGNGGVGGGWTSRYFICH